MKKNKNNQSPKQKPQGPNPMALVIRFAKPYKYVAALLVILTLAATVLSLTLPKYIGYIFDAAAKRENYDNLISTMIIFIAVSLVVGLIQVIAGVYLSQKIALDLRIAISNKISRQTFKFINNITPSKLLSILTSDVDAVRDLVSQSLVLMFSSVFVIIGAGALMFSINWRMTLVAILVIPLILVAFMIVFQKLGVLFEKSRIIIDNLNRVISESIIASSLIRVVNSQKTEINKIGTYNIEARELGYQILKGFAFVFPYINLVTSLAGVVLLYVGANEFLESRLTPGDFVSFFSYFGVLIWPVLTLGFISNLISRAFISIGRINEVLDSKVEEATGMHQKEIEGEIIFKNVSLVLNEKNILKNVSFTVPAHKKTAIIGPTAAGKTQIMYLLTGLIEPTEGEILIDGINVKEYDLKSLYKQMGIVFQDSIIFNTTIEENIDFNKSSRDLSKIVEAAELSDFISKLDEGLNTTINERGSNLSGGQKQRLTLARALAVEPKILLLDDFTARVDKGTEQKIFMNLDQTYPNITSLVISQKIDSIKEFDQIILIMEGEVLAQGTHQELLNTSLEYKQIYESQQSTEN